MHPGDAIGCSEVETTFGHDQHVETGQQTSCGFPPVIVDESFVDNERPAGWKGGVSLIEELVLCSQAPVVQDAPHDHHVRGRKRIDEEVARRITDTMRQTMIRDVGMEEIGKDRQVEARTGEVAMSPCDVDGDATFSAADIDKCRVPIPWKLR